MKKQIKEIISYDGYNTSGYDDIESIRRFLESIIMANNDKRYLVTIEEIEEII